MNPDDKHDQLCQHYRQLREQLDSAYTAAVWDSQCIDQIAAQILTVERALATTRPPLVTDGAQTASSKNLGLSSL